MKYALPTDDGTTVGKVFRKGQELCDLRWLGPEFFVSR